MALPRVLTLDGQGRLRMQVADAAETLRGEEKKLRPATAAIDLARQMVGMAITGYCGELRCTASRAQDWGYRELLTTDIPASEAAIVARVPL